MSESKNGYVLYGGGVTRALGPQMVLEELALPYTLIELDETRGDHKKPDYLAINPAGFIPALITPDGMVMHEAAAIMIYLAEKHHSADLIPDIGDLDRGVFLCQLFYQTNDLQPAIRQFFKPQQFTTDPLHSAGIREMARKTALDRWSVLNGYLQKNGPCVLGHRFSLADLHLTLWASYGLDEPMTVRNRFAAIERCCAMTMDRPKVRPLITKLQADMAAWAGH